MMRIINAAEPSAKMGTVNRAKAFIVHPDMIKQELGVGDAFYVIKTGGFKCDLVKVKF